MAVKRANKRALRANRAKRTLAGGPSKRPRYAKKAKLPARRRRAGGLPLVSRSIRIKHVAGQLSFSSASHIHKADLQVRTMERVGSVNNIVNQTAVKLQSLSGKQFQGSFAMFDCAQLRQINQYALAQTRPTRCVIQGLNNEYTFTNFANAPLELDIYDIALKRDIYTDYAFDTTNGTYTPLPYPESYFGNGLAAQNGLTVYSQPAQIVGASPTDSQLFKDWFIVKRKTTVLLPIGGGHRHMVSVKTNRIVDTMLAGNSGTIAGLKDFTKYVMVNIKGLPVWDDTDGNPGVTSSASQVGIVAVQRLKYTFVQDFSFNSALIQSLPLPNSTATHMWNPGNGVNTIVTGLATLP